MRATRQRNLPPLRRSGSLSCFGPRLDDLDLGHRLRRGGRIDRAIRHVLLAGVDHFGEAEAEDHQHPCKKISVPNSASFVLAHS